MCAGKLDGVVRFGNAWAIPEDAELLDFGTGDRDEIRELE
jgi:hypothetical protein